MFAILAQPILSNGDAVLTYLPLRRKATVDSWDKVVEALHAYAERADNLVPNKDHHIGYEFHIRKAGEAAVLVRTERHTPNEADMVFSQYWL